MRALSEDRQDRVFVDGANGGFKEIPRHVPVTWKRGTKEGEGERGCFFKTGFHHVGQAGLELLTSGDPPALASKVLGLRK